MPSEQLGVTVYLAIMMGLLIPTVIFIVVYYAEPGFPWHTYVTVFLGYYASFAILLLVPIDIAAVVFDRLNTETDSLAYAADRDLLSLWYNIFFTMLLILGSFVMVFEEYYNSDGYTTWTAKTWSSTKRMVISQGPFVLIGIVILIVLLQLNIVSSSTDALLLTAIIVTNTVYEAGLMFLLGYALIEFPRSMWNTADPEMALLDMQMKAALQFKSIQDAQFNISLVASDALKTSKMITERTDPKVAAAMARILSEIPTEFRSDRMGTVAADDKGNITIHSLALLRTKLNEFGSQYRMCQVKVEGTKISAYNMEDIVACKDSPNKIIRWTLLDKDSTTAEFEWHLKRKPILMKIGAVICLILSIFSFLGVVCSMHKVPNQVSVYFLAVHDTDSTSQAGIAIFILVTLGYTAYMVTWALFQVKIAGAMELVPFRTTPESLSFNVRMNARLAAPLAFFYLGWMAENGIKEGDWLYNSAPDLYQNVTVGNVTQTIYTSQEIFMPSSFSDFYQLQSVGIIKSTFGTIFPILLMCVLFLFLIKAFNRILVLLKLDKYQFGSKVVTAEQLKEGKRQLARFKQATERTYRRNDLKRFIDKVSGKEKEGLLGMFGKGEQREAGTLNAVGEEAEAPRVSIREPPALSTYVERKTVKGLSGTWKTVYVEIRSPGYLHIYKDKLAADATRNNGKEPSSSSDATAQVINLGKAKGFSVPDRKGKDNTCVDVESRGEPIRFKLKDLKSAVEWKNALQAWADFHRDHGEAYPSGMGMARDKSIQMNPMVAYDEEAGSGNGRSSSPFRGAGGKEDKKKGGGMLGGMGGMRDQAMSMGKEKGAGAASKGASQVLSMPPPSPEKGYDDKPEVVEGWLEKKDSGKMMGESWSKTYVRIDEKKACMSYFKSNGLKELPIGSIDLKMVTDINYYEAKGGSMSCTRFNVDMGDKVYKFKVNTDSEGKKWVEGLNEWRDYFLMNMA